MKTLDELTAAEHRKIASLKEQIEAILNGKTTPAKAPVVAATGTPKKKKKMSKAARAAISEAKKAWWAKKNKGKKAVKGK